MNDEAQREFREAQAYFRLPSVGLVEKDVHVVRAIRAVMSIEAAPFALIFGGGTALARAHKLVRRMSEDVDFKIVPQAAAPVSCNGLRRELGRVGDKVTQALQDAGFAFDPADKTTASGRKVRTAIPSGSYPMPALAGQGRGCGPPSRSS